MEGVLLTGNPEQGFRDAYYLSFVVHQINNTIPTTYSKQKPCDKLKIADWRWYG